MFGRSTALTTKGVTYTPEIAGSAVDIYLEGIRVWTCALPSNGRKIPWPRALNDLLHGKAVGRIVSTASKEELWSGTVSWPGTGSPDIVDEQGRGLRLDKWGRMKPTFETGEDIRPRVAASAARMISVLTDHGFDAFIVGGTLLGAVRDGEILPHDDDADIAYLSKHSDPVDLILENNQLHRSLLARGFRVVRHSWAHLQVLSDDDSYYVDIFTAFHKAGYFHEPIHVRAPGMTECILPLGALELHEQSLAVPHDPEAWLTACYGPQWLTPDPAFAFETPWPTQRRFHAWFGSFHMGLNSWKSRRADGESSHETDLLRRHAASAGDSIVDLASGDGEDLAFYRAMGIPSIGVDAVASSVSVREGEPHVNLVDYLPAFSFLREALSASGNSPVVTANHLLACQDPRGRATLLHLAHYALRRGARVLTADYEQLGDYRPDSPRTWHLAWSTRVEEAQRAGLECELLERKHVRDEDGVRRSVAVVEYRTAEKEKQ